MSSKGRHPLLLALAGFALVAGCLSSTAAPKAASDAPMMAAPAFDDSTGSVHGLIHSEELAPIKGAQVGVPGTNATAVTDDGGAFALNYLKPGKVTVAVVALGYRSESKLVDVVAGQAVEQNFVLTALPSLVPYSATEIFHLVEGGFMVKATPDCMYVQSPTGGGASGTKTCQGGADCGPNSLLGDTQICEVHYGHCGDKNYQGGTFAKFGCGLTPDWKTIIGEVQWTPGTALTGRGWSFEVLAPNVTRSSGSTGSVDQSDKHDWWQLTSKNPIHTRIDDATMEAGSPSGSSHPISYPADRCGGIDATYPNCDWVWRIFPGWCTVNGVSAGAAGCEKTGPDFDVDAAGTNVDVYFSYFIREPAPAGYTAIPDA